MIAACCTPPPSSSWVNLSPALMAQIRELDDNECVVKYSEEFERQKPSALAIPYHEVSRKQPAVHAHRALIAMRSKGAVPLVTCTPSGKLICSGRWCETLSLNIYIEWHILVTGALAHLETCQRLRMRENLNIPGTESCNQRTFCYGCRQNYRNKKNKGLYLTRGRRKKTYDCDMCENESKMCGFFQNSYIHFPYIIFIFSYNSVGLGGRVSTIRIHAANYMFFFSRE